MEAIPITRSPKGLQSIILSSGIFTILVILLSFVILNIILSWAPSTESTLKVLIILFLGGTWILYSILLSLKWNSTKYYIGKHAIVVTNSRLGGRTKTMYRYESIVKVTMEQGYLGKRNGYGDIIMAMPKVEEDIVLKDIDNPVAQLAEIQDKISEFGSSTHALIN